MNKLCIFCSSCIHFLLEIDNFNFIDMGCGSGRLVNYLEKNFKRIFVGIDIINEKLTEINVTSPTGIVQIQEHTGINIAKNLWTKLLKN